jgi:hypothetical protein
VRAFWIFALLLVGLVAAGGQAIPAGNYEEPASITLTSGRTTGSFPLDSETLASAPPILSLTLTKIVNPEKLPFQILACLSYRSEGSAKSHDGRQKILIGNFGLYPPDHPGTFSLSTSNAFAELKSKAPKPSEVRLLLEMKRIHESAPWTPVEVTVAPPEWPRK